MANQLIAGWNATRGLFFGFCSSLRGQLYVAIAGFALVAYAQVMVLAESPAVDRLGVPILLLQVECDGAGTPPAPRLPGTLLGVTAAQRLVLLQPGKRPEVLLPDFYATSQADVFFDGTKFLFSGRKSADDPWNVYEFDLQNRSIRQVTKDSQDCLTPCYQSTQYVLDAPLPWFQITFFRVLTDSGKPDPWMLASLFSCRMDGTHFRRLTVNLGADLPGVMIPNGRIVYPSFRSSPVTEAPSRIDLLAVNTDGTDPANFLPGVGKKFKLMPAMVPQGRLGKLIFVENDELLPDGAGQLACVDLRRPLRTYQSLTAESDFVYHSPSALPDGRLLVSRRPRSGGKSYELGVFDLANKTWQPLFDDPRQHDVFAKAVVPRPMPDGRSSAVDDQKPLGTIYCLSVYDSDLPKEALPVGSIKKLRILEGIPPGSAPQNGPPAAADMRMRVLGEIPVFPDGSFQVEVPSDTPLMLQLIDERGLNVRNSGWIWVKGGVHQGCIGCHEDPERVPFNRMADALWEERPIVDGKSAQVAPDFLHDIWPIFERACQECHSPAGVSPRLTDSPERLASNRPIMSASTAYAVLLGKSSTELSVREDCEARTYVRPGLARLSPLVWHLTSQNLAQCWDGPSRDQAVKVWPEHAQSRKLSWEELRLVIEWIDCGAIFDRTEVSSSRLVSDLASPTEQ